LQYLRIRRLPAGYWCVSPPPLSSLSYPSFSSPSLLFSYWLTVYIVTSFPAILGAPTLPYARRSFLPRGSVVYDMHIDYQHSPPPASAFCSSTTPNATCSVTTKLLPACLTRAALTTSPPTPYHAHTLPPRTRDTTGSRCCRSSARALPSLPCGRSDDLQQGQRVRLPTAGRMSDTTAVRGIRCVHFPPLMLLSLPPTHDDHLRRSPILAQATTICTTTRWRSARGRTIDASTRRSPGYHQDSTQEHLHTSDALPVHTVGQTHGALRHAMRSTPPLPIESVIPPAVGPPIPGPTPTLSAGVFTSAFPPSPILSTQLPFPLVTLR
jgi:hypothetical protein